MRSLAFFNNCSVPVRDREAFEQAMKKADDDWATTGTACQAIILNFADASSVHFCTLLRRRVEQGGVHCHFVDTQTGEPVSERAALLHGLLQARAGVDLKGFHMHGLGIQTEGRAVNGCGPLSHMLIRQLDRHISSGADPSKYIEEFAERAKKLSDAELNQKVSGVHKQLIRGLRRAARDVHHPKGVPATAGPVSSQRPSQDLRSAPAAVDQHRAPKATVPLRKKGVRGADMADRVEVIGGVKYCGLKKQQLSHPLTRTIGKFDAKAAGSLLLVGAIACAVMPPVGIALIGAAVLGGITGVLARMKQQDNIARYGSA